MVEPLSGIRAVQQRIAEIEERFGVPRRQQRRPTVPVQAQDFQETLRAELENINAQVEASVSRQASGKRAPHEGAAARAFAEAGNNAPVPEHGSVDEMIQAAAQKYHVDPKLVSAVAIAESGKNQSEISSAGAIGVMQLMPGTAAALGVDPYDIGQNIDGGAKLLRQMLDSFGGDVRKAVAAYNAGPGAVKKYGGIPPYRETQNYVSKVLDLYR